jgi:hypothetical protein
MVRQFAPGISALCNGTSYGCGSHTTPVTTANALHEWTLAQRDLVPDGSATAKALDYTLKRWKALTRYLNDGAVPIDNNWVEN